MDKEARPPNKMYNVIFIDYRHHAGTYRPDQHCVVTATSPQDAANKARTKLPDLPASFGAYRISEIAADWFVFGGLLLPTDIKDLK